MRLIIALFTAVFLTIGSAHAGGDPLAEMLEADRAFADMAGRDGPPAAFAAYAAEDVRMFPEGGLPFDGRTSMIERFANWPEGATLSWTPQGGAAAPGGDFGYTWGLSVFTVRSESGDETAEHGKYVTIWRRGADGVWKFIADIGNAAPAPE